MVTNASQITVEFQSPELENQLAAMDDAKALIELMVREAVGALFASPYPLPMAEKLNAMGPVVVPELERRIQNARVSEPAIHAALLLLHFGSPAGVPHLLQALAAGMGPTVLIVKKLIAAGVPVPGAAEAVTEALRKAPASKNPYITATLIECLQSLGKPVPEQALEDLEMVAPYLRQLLALSSK